MLLVALPQFVLAIPLWDTHPPTQILTFNFEAIAVGAKIITNN